MDVVSALRSLHTAAIDARDGYRHALEEAAGEGLTPLFRTMAARHSENANELAVELQKRGETISDDGSLMATVHKTVLSLRSMFGGLDEKILPGLIDGERRNIAGYDEALGLPDLDNPLRVSLSAQRNRLTDQLTRMRAAEADARFGNASDTVAIS